MRCSIAVCGGATNTIARIYFAYNEPKKDFAILSTVKRPKEPKSKQQFDSYIYLF